jgi:hypothetical protein
MILIHGKKELKKNLGSKEQNANGGDN